VRYNWSYNGRYMLPAGTSTRSLFEDRGLKRPSRKALDQAGIILLVAGVVIAMGVSAVRGLATWLQILGLVLGLIFVAVGLWMARTFRNKDPNRPHRPDQD
jgi:preprotein translocase subunit SecD